MSQLFQLKKDVVLRKEYFGCICCNLGTGEYFQYNADAFELLCEFASPVSLPSILNKIRDRGIQISNENFAEFVTSLILNGLLTEIDPLDADQYSVSIYYKDKKDFFKDRLVAPATCTIYITEHCSKRCLHCVTRSGPDIDTSNDFGHKEWIKILDKLKTWGVFALIFTGGEPLMKKGIFEVLNYASDIGFHISLLTDFDGLKQRHIDKLKTIEKLNYIQMSLDGASEKNHDFMRGKGAFQKAIKRMKLFQENDIGFTISTAVHKGNLHEIDAIADIYHRYQAKYLYLNPLAPYGRAKNQLEHLLLSDDELKFLALKYYELISDKNVDSGNAFWQGLSKADVNLKSFHPFKNCLDAMSTGVYLLSINSTGDVYLDSKMKSEQLLKLGNALTDDFNEMWENPFLTPLRAICDPGEPSLVDHNSVLRIVNSGVHV